MDFDTLKALAADGPMTLVVDGQCMGDSLPDGSQVRVARQRIYWPGDIVVYGRGDGKLVSHRLLGLLPGITGWLVLTTADNAAEPDMPTSLSRVVGKVLSVDGEPTSCPPGTRLLAVLRYVAAASLFVAGKIRGALRKK